VTSISTRRSLATKEIPMLDNRRNVVDEPGAGSLDRTARIVGTDS